MRSMRPQLFNAPTIEPGARRQSEAGPGILATIDGGQGHDVSSGSDLSRQPVWWVLGSLILLLGALALAWDWPRDSARDIPGRPAIVAVSPVSRVEPIADEVASTSSGAALIETVPRDPAAHPATDMSAPLSASATAAAVGLSGSQVQASAGAPSADPIRQAAVPGRTLVTKSETVAAAKPKVPAQAESRKGPPTSQSTVGKAATPKSQTATTRKGASSQDTDAELLAAMLPHLRRTKGSASSPAYERRCGQLSGDALVSCRARFCNGREGQDAACPAGASASH